VVYDDILIFRDNLCWSFFGTSFSKQQMDTEKCSYVCLYAVIAITHNLLDFVW